VTATERRLREGYEFVRMLANAPLALDFQPNLGALHHHFA